MAPNYSSTLLETHEIIIFFAGVAVAAQFFCWLRQMFFIYVCDFMIEQMHIKKPEVQVKFRETLWFFCYYLWCVCLIMDFAVPNFQYVHPITNDKCSCWYQIGFHQDEAVCPTPFTLKLYGFCQSAFYLHALIVVFQGTNRFAEWSSR